MTKAQHTLRQRQVAGAKRYAEANRSDPFALNVALSHIKNGICDPRPALHAKDPDAGKEAHYDATPISVKRRLAPGLEFSNGTNEYHVTEHKNMVRV